VDDTLGKIMVAKCSNPTLKERGQATMRRAGELRRESTPAERKLWAYLRANKLNGVNFRRQHAIGNYTSTSSAQALLTLSRSKRSSSLSWMELPEAASSRHRAIDDVSHRVSTWSKLNMTPNEPNI
jgi:hypothetical protein